MYKEKTLLLLSKADLIYTDQAVNKGIDVVVNEFKSNFPSDINCSDKKIYPLSILYKDNFDKSDLNDLYKKRIENGEETKITLSNYDTILAKIEELAAHVKNSVEKDGKEQKPIAMNYRNLLLDKLCEAKVSYDTNSEEDIGQRLESIKEKINRLDKRIRECDIDSIAVENHFELMVKPVVDDQINKLQDDVNKEVDKIEELKFEELFENGKQ
jgi:hypothetical protein